MTFTELLPADRLQAVRTMRAAYTEATGARTYSIPWVRIRHEHDLFDTDVPWNSTMEREALEVLASLEAIIGCSLDIELRNTRMTVFIPV